MDPRTIELNNLRVLNDYLNQTLDALVRAPRGGVSPAFGVGQAWGVGSPFGAQSSIAGDPMYGALQWPYPQAYQHAYGVPFAGGLPGPAYRTYGDYSPYGGGLAHSGLGWNPWGVSPAEVARQQFWMYGRPFATQYGF